MNVGYATSGDAPRLTNFFVGFIRVVAFFAYLPDFIIRKNAMRTAFKTVGIRMKMLFGMCGPFKILRPIIVFYAVLVVYGGLAIGIGVKGGSDQSGNKELAMASKSDMAVSVFVYNLTPDKNARPNKLHTAFVSTSTEKRANTPLVANFVLPFVARNRCPNFIIHNA